MDKIDNNITNYNHGISVIERKNIIVTGVKKRDDFDNEELRLPWTKTLHSQCRKTRFIPWSGNYIPHVATKDPVCHN